MFGNCLCSNKTQAWSFILIELTNHFPQLNYSIITYKQNLKLCQEIFLSDLKLLALVKVPRNINDTDCLSKKAELKENNKRFMAQIQRESLEWITITLPSSWFIKINLYKANKTTTCFFLRRWRRRLWQKTKQF